ncbi:MAG TPA: MerR family transcriptional regulator, partial [Nitrospirales bacterium]|nr:MerR family transcriptional regulator [Nitrospirales bacterium]
MRIGEVSKQAGVRIDTVRFYERKGLIVEPPRDPTGHRRYPPDAVTEIQFIQRAKALGFSLSEVAELLALQGRPDATCHDVKAQAEAKMATIRERLRDLQNMNRSLGKLVASCDGHGPIEDCPIMECFEKPYHEEVMVCRTHEPLYRKKQCGGRTEREDWNS